MRIAITGGAGCLGSNLIEHLVPQGHQILVIDNFVTGKRELVTDISGVSLIEGSVADAALVQNAFADFLPDAVIHAAASYKNPDAWTDDIATNVQGSANVARAAEMNAVKRLVNLQTNLCYGRPTTIPVPIDHPLAPFTSYGITKTAGEQFMMMGKVPTISLRLANVLGPRLAIGPVPTFYKRLKLGQKCFCSDTARDFMDMSDFLAFMDRALHADAPIGVFNLASGEAHSIKEIFDLVCAHLGLAPQDVPIVPAETDDVAIMTLDASKTFSAFGFGLKVSFAEAIKNQLDWYDRHGVTDIFSHLRTPASSELSDA
jgi:nucleoside-diphosphate-sugar epimerase